MNDYESGIQRRGIARTARFTCAALIAVVHTISATEPDLRNKLTDLIIRSKTEHYELAGTVSKARLDEYGRCLEYIHAEYVKGFADLVSGGAATTALERAEESAGATGKEPTRQERSRDSGDRVGDHSGEQSRFKVIVFSADRGYEEFAEGFLGGPHEHTRGLFIASLELLVIRDDPTMQETIGVLFHEAFHQFMHRYVPNAPTWLNEGLATYYGTARPTAHGLVFDRPRSEFFAVIRDAVDAKQLIPFDELMTAEPNDFYNREPIDGLGFDRATLRYGQSYTFIAYILDDRAGREHLRGYLKALARVRSTDDARRVSQTHFSGPLLGKLVPGWLAFVNRN